MPLYYVYCAEYPDEGSEVVRADTVEEARALGFKMGFTEDPGDVGVALVRPGDGWAGTCGRCGSTATMDTIMRADEQGEEGICRPCLIGVAATALRARLREKGWTAAADLTESLHEWLDATEAATVEVSFAARTPPDLDELRFALDELDALRSEPGYEDGDHAAAERDLLDEIAGLARAVVDWGAK